MLSSIMRRIGRAIFLVLGSVQQFKNFFIGKKAKVDPVLFGWILQPNRRVTYFVKEGLDSIINCAIDHPVFN